MNRNPAQALIAICCIAILSPLAFIGCDKSETPAPSDASSAPGSADADVPSSLKGPEKEAAAATMLEIAAHWSKGPDGWTTALAEGSAFAPIKFLRQVKSLSVDSVESNELSDADKLNGFEWAGEVSLKKTVGREAGTNGIVFGGEAGPNVERHPGRWSQWVDHDPQSLHAQKIKGKWRFDQNNPLVAGTAPKPEDWAAAGVK